MKAVIYVFSGTDNTFLAAEMVAEGLESRGVETDIWRVRVPFSDAPDPRNYSIALFAYPVHAFNTPKFFLNFVKTLPRVDYIPAYIFKTSGEPFKANNSSSYTLTHLLRKKGFVPGRDTHMLMPYNIMFRYEDSLAKQMYLHTKQMADDVADLAARKFCYPAKFNFFITILMYIFRLQWLGARINGRHIRADAQKCIGCGICERSCPAGNITMADGVPVFSNHCTMCMSCVMRCSRDAVHPGFLNGWRVNGQYDFEKLVSDDSISPDYINENTRGYFGHFRKYYSGKNK